MSWEKEAEEIKARRNFAKQQGGPEGVKRQHDKGRLTIRERISHLADDASFKELGEGAGVPEFDNDGSLKDLQPANYVLGFAKVNGRRVITVKCAPTSLAAGMPATGPSAAVATGTVPMTCAID